MGDQLRAALEASFESAPELPQGAQSVDDAVAVDAPIVDESTTQESAVQRARDEQGRFAAKAKEDAEQAEIGTQEAPITPDAQQAAPEVQDAPTGQPLDLKYPTTWKKESAELLREVTQWMPPQKAKQLVDYLNQRESDFANGVSTYRAEAMQAKGITDALAPFIPELQRNGVEPSQWLSNLGNTHYALINANPQQKLEMFAKLARDYQVPLQGVLQADQGQYDPYLIQQMQQSQELESRITSIQAWQQQQEVQAIQQQVNSYRANPEYAHFDAVAPDMARMIETGFVKTIEEAYPLAVRMRADLSTGNTSGAVAAIAQQEPATQAPATAPPPLQSKQEIAAKARAAAISPKSGAKVATAPVNPKDLRGQLVAQFDAVANGRI